MCKQFDYNVFKGHTGEAVQSLLEDNKIFHVTLPHNCTDILHFAALDLSITKPFKDKLRKGFS